MTKQVSAVKRDTSPQYEITIDGTPRTYRDKREHTIEAGKQFKQKYPHSAVVMRDMRTDDKVTIPDQPPIMRP